MESVLAKEIKTFRKQFKKQYGRDPTKKDMAKEPGMAEKYESWLKLKSGQQKNNQSLNNVDDESQEIGRASSSTLPSEKVASSSSLQQGKNNASNSTKGDHMAPPPTTPRKRIPSTLNEMFQSRTPKSSLVEDKEMMDTVNNSGGSIRSLIDVPTTPIRKQKMKHPHTPQTPHNNEFNSITNFDDGTSPSKLKSLIDSFTATRSRTSSITPTKKDHQKDDSKLAFKLQSSRSKIQNASLFTPRTKARKRLRGEIVITPKKDEGGIRIDGQNGGEGKHSTPTKASNRPTKRQRGMGTLKDFGIVSIGGSQTKMNVSSLMMKKGREMEDLKEQKSDGHDEVEDDDDDDDDDLIGPSPSTQRIVNLPIHQAFRPLFGQTSDMSDNLLEQIEEDDDDDEVMSYDLEIHSSQPGNDTETALTTPTVETNEEMDSDEEERMYLRDYARSNGSRRRGEEEEEEEEEIGAGFLPVKVTTLEEDEQERRNEVSDEEEHDLLKSLSINSPQGKRARKLRKRETERNLRNLLRSDNLFTKAAALATSRDVEEFDAEDEDEEVVGLSKDLQSGTTSKKNTWETASKVKTAKMMRGTLTKTAKRALAAAEAKEEVARTDSKDDQQSIKQPNSNQDKPIKQKMIFRRGREDDLDDSDEEDLFGDQIDLEQHSEQQVKLNQTFKEQDDDEWASDVDSVEYGLGDGYMDEMDII